MYLIRAEANMLRSAANKNNVIDDLNAIRHRAGLDHLPYTLTDQQVTDAIAQERRVELFAEWGHRWLDLKRTNKASEVLSQLSYKQPWSQHQLLYPVPPEERLWANQLSQNEGYY
ncbi:RagB/SusD family nutrient uptake outer membrane protein [Chitinophaga sedimenti]|nr:RagB/SusD family nutrient uptake outer membrane protein [Chitinophaga sedimenti]MCK7554088.1 RagB/SusD family nutrient uptake outer membrane protein [Chitinophaga sedimenti]